MTKKRVLVAMSGGVDSSVAAALLLEQGYQVEGVMMRLWAESLPGERAENTCCSLAAQADARKVTERLGIHLRIIDMAMLFKQLVVDPFVAAYAAGLTPNPCLACNRRLRLGLLLSYSLGQGADYLATGHYCRIGRDEAGRYTLLRGVDRQKDQSYVLHMAQQEHLAHLLFPVGVYEKRQIRQRAVELGLPVAQKPESQDLCFVADDYRNFLRRHAPEILRPGPVVRRDGEVVGWHRGLPFYTVGQRKGLGIAAREPLYVLELCPERNELVVGTAAELGRRTLVAQRVSWVAGTPPSSPAVTAKIRYKAVDAAAELSPLDHDHWLVRFDSPLRDITPGQGVVFYQGERCLGGGLISRERVDE